jgi:uncharacterized protein with NRDE domain
MCTVLVAYKQHPLYPLILLSNRDEFYSRASQPPSFWSDRPGVYAGKDLVAGGTWLGFTLKKRMAVITNYRDMRIVHDGKKTRGQLPLGFLDSDLTAIEYGKVIKREEKEYDPFNLLIFDGENLLYSSNQSKITQILEGGYYGLSNSLLDIPWHKVERGKAALKLVIEADGYTRIINETSSLTQKLMTILWDEEEALDTELPDTGLSLESERLVSRMHITSKEYGTRFKTVALLDHNGFWHLYESYLGNDRIWRDKKCTLGIG